MTAVAPEPDHSTPPAAGRRYRPVAHATLAATLAALAAVVLTLGWAAVGDELATGPRTALLATALVAQATSLALVARRGAAPTMRTAAAIVALGLVGAVVLPLHRSADVYLYDLYGRMVGVHGTNPYADPPSTVADDPLYPHVSEDWYEQRALYGPAFVALSVPVSLLAGTSPTVVADVWQAVAAAAVAAAAVVVARRTRDPAAVLALGASPVVLAAVVDGHNDVLVGLALLAAVALTERHRPALAGVAAGLAVAAKLTVAVPLAGLALWVLVRRGGRAVAQLVGIAAAVTALGYLAAGGRALDTLRESSGDDSRFALWQPLRNDAFESLRAEGWRFRPALELVRDRMALWSLVALVVVLLVIAWRYRRSAAAAETTVAAGLAHLLVATYVVPWYPAALAPTAALAWRSRASALLWLQSALLLLAYAEPPGTDAGSAFGRWLEDPGAALVGAALLALLVLWCRPSTPLPTSSLPEVPPPAGPGAEGAPVTSRLP